MPYMHGMSAKLFASFDQSHGFNYTNTDTLQSSLCAAFSF